MVVVTSRRSRSVFMLCLLLFVSRWMDATHSLRFGFSMAAAKDKASNDKTANKEEGNRSKDKKYKQSTREESNERLKQGGESTTRQPSSTEDINVANDKTESSSSSSSSSWLDGFTMEDYSPEKEQQQAQEEHEFPPLPDHMIQNPLLQVPCSLQVEASLTTSLSALQPVATFVDTGAQVTILKLRAAQRARVLHLMDRRYAGHAIGVGQCRVLGRIPAGALRMHLHGYCVSSPAITILDVDDDHHNHDNSELGSDKDQKSSGVELLLGLDFLRDYQAVLNLREGEMRLLVKGHQEEAVIPFLLPRSRNVQNGQPNDSPMLQQCKSWILPLGEEVDDEDEYSDMESSGSAEPIDMSGV